MISLIYTLQDKFNQLLSLLPDLREMAQRGEDFLYFKHMQGHAPHHTLLMEMLLAKRNDVVSFTSMNCNWNWSKNYPVFSFCQNISANTVSRGI